MITARSFPATTYIFGHARVWSLARSIPAVCGLLLLLAAAATLQSPLPLLLALLPGALLIHAVLRHSTEGISVSIHGLTVHQGALVLDSVSMPFWRLHVETRQPVFGRICNYGSVRLLCDNVWYELHGVDDFIAFRSLIFQRQAEQAILSPVLTIEAHRPRFPPH
jgi:hypothetical protein